MQCKQAHEYAHIKCKQSMFMSLLPLLVCFPCPRLLIQLFCLMLLPCPCPSLISPPWNISFVVQLIPWSYLCSNFSPFVISFHKRYVIPIKSLDTNWKSVNLIVTKDCIGIDGWGLNLVFFDGHHHMCWNDIIWIALKIPHRIFDLDTIWWGTPPMS